ncbi:tetratricopeptide repeat protein [Curvivirga aplysinae]|uniref:tetratricopeptide repeat protein n=1 Tax=Curvivirga aplysinae TaxID=2529852 RepID=UPI0012BD1857|nr:hypothetical protein [Curvivirga aplysinae]MTI09648.1 hypothetical protein [Curvivirga aplysinae]
MIDTDLNVKQLWQILLSGNPNEALQKFQENMLLSPADPQNWSGMMACACATGNIPAALRILDQRHTHFSDGPIVTLASMMGFASTRQERILEFLVQNWPKERADYVLILYHYGHLLLELDQLKNANKIFLECKKLFLENKDELKIQENADLFSTYRQCVNLISFEDVNKLTTKSTTYLSKFVGEIDWQDPPETSPLPIGLVAADKHYTKTFGRDFFQSLNQFWPTDNIFHLHIIDPDAETPSLIDEIKAACPNIDLKISLNTKPSEINMEKSPYYASLRFFMLTSLLKRYKSPIMTFDIDMIAKVDLTPIPNAIKDYDYIRFKRPSFGPGGYEYAALTAFQGSNGYKIADLTAKIIAKRIEESSTDLWFVDQTALYQAYCYFRQNDSIFNDGSFYDYIPELDHFFHHLDAEEIKIKLSQIS